MRKGSLSVTEREDRFNKLADKVIVGDFLHQDDASVVFAEGLDSAGILDLTLKGISKNCFLMPRFQNKYNSLFSKNLILPNPFYNDVYQVINILKFYI